MESQAIIEAVASHAMATGLFDAVNQYEPKSAHVATNLYAAVWAQTLAPQAAASGLDATTVRFILNVRIYTNMLGEPADMIDPNLVAAVDVLMAAYTGDFTLDGLVKNIDLLGQGGQGLSAEAGYVEIDKKMFRVMTISVPMIINDVWEQSP